MISGRSGECFCAVVPRIWHFVPDGQCGILRSLALLLGIFGSMSLHNRLCLRFTTYVTASRSAWCDQS